MKQPDKKERLNSVTYKCIYCDLEQNFTIAVYMAHLDKSHSELSESDQSGVIKDLSNKIVRFNREQKNAGRKKKKKLEIENKQVELNKFKERVLTVLEQTDIKPQILENIKSKISITKIKSILSSSLKKEIQHKLSEEGIDYYIEIKRKKRKYNKKDFHDETKKSIKPIYTPMGNKR